MKLNGIENGDIQFSGEDTTEPVSVADLKQWLRMRTAITADDALLESIIKVARIQIERYTGLSLISRTVNCWLRNEMNMVELPFGPVDEITFLKDNDGNELVEDDGYELKGTEFFRIDAPGYHRIEAEYTAGYSTVPENLITAIKRQAAWIYEHRGDERESKLDPLLAVELKAVRRAWV